jgi:hypothetical protein
MCSTKSYIRVHVGRNLPEVLPIKEWFETRRCSIAIAFQLCFRRVQVSQDGLKLNGTYQLLVYADDVILLGGIVHTVKENAEVLVVASKENPLELNANKSKYMVMSRDQNAGRNRNNKIDNSSFEKVEELKYLGTTLTNQNSIQEQIKNRLKSGNS